MQSGVIILHLSRPELGRLDTYFLDTSYFSLRSRNTFCCCINQEESTSCEFNFALVRATGKLDIFKGLEARNRTRAPSGAIGCTLLKGRLIPPVVGDWSHLSSSKTKFRNDGPRTAGVSGLMSECWSKLLKPNKESIMSKSILTDADDETKNALTAAHRVTGKSIKELSCLCLRAYLARQNALQKQQTSPFSPLPALRQSRAVHSSRKA